MNTVDTSIQYSPNYRYRLREQIKHEIADHNKKKTCGCKGFDRAMYRTFREQGLKPEEISFPGCRVCIGEAWPSTSCVKLMPGIWADTSILGGHSEKEKNRLSSLMLETVAKFNDQMGQMGVGFMRIRFRLSRLRLGHRFLLFVYSPSKAGLLEREDVYRVKTRPIQRIVRTRRELHQNIMR